MFWRRKPKSPQPGTPTLELGTHDLDEQLVLDVSLYWYQTDHEPIECWRYLSRGLGRHAQPEVGLLIKREIGEESPPAEYAAVFRTIDYMMQRDYEIGPGCYSIVKDAAGTPRGLCYVDAPDTTDFPEGTTLLILLSEGEGRVVQEAGSTRVLARLGKAARFYPFPPWHDRQRAVVGEGPEDSMLSKMPRLRGTGTACLLDETVTVRLPGSSRENITEALADLDENTPFALTTRYPVHVGAQFTWSPGQQSPYAIYQGSGPDTSIPQASDLEVGGAFVAFAGPLETSGGRLCEDGFVMLLNTQDWGALRAALTQGTDLDVPATGEEGHALALRWH